MGGRTLRYPLKSKDLKHYIQINNQKITRKPTGQSCRFLFFTRFFWKKQPKHSAIKHLILRRVEGENAMQTMECIAEFRGKYYFLSNFYGAPVEYNGIRYTNNEAAFQAQKQPERAHEFASLPPNEAKRLGRRVRLRPDWEAVKKRIMAEIVYAKFAQNPDLREKLLATGHAELIEGNTWNDTYWGVCRGKGRNELGIILMQTRNELRNGA